MARIKFMNTEIDNLTMQEALEKIDNLIQTKKGAYVVTPNVDHMMMLILRYFVMNTTNYARL